LHGATCGASWRLGSLALRAEMATPAGACRRRCLDLAQFHGGRQSGGSRARRVRGESHDVSSKPRGDDSAAIAMVRPRAATPFAARHPTSRAVTSWRVGCEGAPFARFAGSPGPLLNAASVLRAGEGARRTPAGGNCEQIQGHILAMRDARYPRACRGLSPLLEVYAANRGSIDRAMRPRLMTLSGETP